MTAEQQQAIQDASHRISELCGELMRVHAWHVQKFMKNVKEIYRLNVEISRAIQEAHKI